MSRHRRRVVALPRIHRLTTLRGEILSPLCKKFNSLIARCVDWKARCTWGGDRFAQTTSSWLPKYRNHYQRPSVKIRWWVIIILGKNKERPIKSADRADYAGWPVDWVRARRQVKIKCCCWSWWWWWYCCCWQVNNQHFVSQFGIDWAAPSECWPDKIRGGLNDNSWVICQNYQGYIIHYLNAEIGGSTSGPCSRENRSIDWRPDWSIRKCRTSISGWRKKSLPLSLFAPNEMLINILSCNRWLSNESCSTFKVGWIKI